MFKLKTESKVIKVTSCARLVFNKISWAWKCRLLRKLKYFTTVRHKYFFAWLQIYFSAGRARLQLFSLDFSRFAAPGLWSIARVRTNPLFVRPRLHPSGQECGQGTNLQHRLQFQGVPELSTLFSQIISAFCRLHCLLRVLVMTNWLDTTNLCYPAPLPTTNLNIHTRLFSLTGPQFPEFLLPFRKPKRIRTAFSPTQLLKLEHAFEKNQYVVGQERKELAKSLNLSETQVNFAIQFLLKQL